MANDLSLLFSPWSWPHHQRNVGSIRFLRFICVYVLSHTPVELLDILWFSLVSSEIQDNYACFCSTTTLTSKITAEFEKTIPNFPCGQVAAIHCSKSTLMNREITCDTVINRHLRPRFPPSERSRGNAPDLLRLWRVHVVTLRDKVRSCEICKAQNFKHFSSESRDPSYPVRPPVQSAPRKFGKSCWLHPRKVAESSPKDQVEWLYLWPCLVPSWYRASWTI